MQEYEPTEPYDPIIVNLTRYMRDVYSIKADMEIEQDIKSINFRLAESLYDILELAGASYGATLDHLEAILPQATIEDIGVNELVSQYKLAPLRMLNQRTPGWVFPLERLTPLRIEKFYNFVLAGEETRHDMDCISGDEQAILLCDFALTCPMRLGRTVGKDLLGLYVIQDRFNEDSTDEVDTLISRNINQLRETLVAHHLLFPSEVTVYTKLATRYADELLSLAIEDGTKEEKDETNDT